MIRVARSRTGGSGNRCRRAADHCPCVRRTPGQQEHRCRRHQQQRSGNSHPSPPAGAAMAGSLPVPAPALPPHRGRQTPACSGRPEAAAANPGGRVPAGSIPPAVCGCGAPLPGRSRRPSDRTPGAAPAPPPQSHIPSRRLHPRSSGSRRTGGSAPGWTAAKRGPTTGPASYSVLSASRSGVGTDPICGGINLHYKFRHVPPQRRAAAVRAPSARATAPAPR